MHKISLIIPAYNEEDRIGALLDELMGLFERSGNIFEIIVVDDGSIDNTKKIAYEYDVKVVHHASREGYGASLKSGILKATGNYVCIIDADNTYFAEDIPIVVNEINENDMVVGDRQDDKDRPKDHLVVKKGVERLLSRIFKVEVKDINSGLRIMGKDIVIRYLGLLPQGFSFTSSITLIMLLKGYKIKYVPIKYNRRKKGSKIRRFSFVIGFVRSYLRILMRYFLRKL